MTATQIPVLADIDWQGKPRKVMFWANRNGFFYVLDRETGQFLMGKPFIKVTWANGLDKNGRPIRTPKYFPKPAGGIAAMPGGKEARTIILHLTTRKRGSSICPSGTTTKVFRANGPFLRGSRCICIPETVGGPALGKRRPRLTGRPLLPCRAFPLQKGVQVRITRRRPRGTVQSAPSIRKPARRSGTSRWCNYYRMWRAIHRRRLGVRRWDGRRLYGTRCGDRQAVVARIPGRCQCEWPDHLRCKWETIRYRYRC